MMRASKLDVDILLAKNIDQPLAGTILNDFAKQQLLRESSLMGQFSSFIDHLYVRDFGLPWNNLLCIILLQAGKIDQNGLMTMNCDIE